MCSQSVHHNEAIVKFQQAWADLGGQPTPAALATLRNLMDGFYIRPWFFEDGRTVGQVDLVCWGKTGESHVLTVLWTADADGGAPVA